jgi:hypothetical protein
MKKADILTITFFSFLALILYSSVFYLEYLYTDEAAELWYFKNGINFGTSVPQGRYISYKIFVWIFGFIKTSHDVIFARVISLVGWIICIPIWYFILKKVLGDRNKMILLLSMVYMICMPSFTISIVWASCLEIFLATTAGLISGYILYIGIKYEQGRINISSKTIASSLIFGIISLFTYQTGFGCFFLPFFLLYISEKKFSKVVNIGLISGVLIYGIYFLLFKYSIKANGLQPSERGLLAFDDPIGRVQFLLANPIASGFHFTKIFTEDGLAGRIWYYVFLLVWLVFLFIEMKTSAWKNKIMYLPGLLLFFILIYLPFMLIKEKYSSNRTLFALDFAVFFMIIHSVFVMIKNEKYKKVLAAVLVVVFIGNGWYNINNEFLGTISTEFSKIKKIFTEKYSPSIDSIYYIRPSENAFEEKYRVTRSWDEFGVPSTAKNWTPEPLFKQLVFEKTKSRDTAEKLVVKTWQDIEAFKKDKVLISDRTLFIDGSKLISEH